MAVGSFTGYSPLRPPQVRDLELELNGDLNFLGVLVSTGAAVDNSTTATPFNTVAANMLAVDGSQIRLTLAGKALLIQPTAAGHVLASPLQLLGSPAGLVTVTTFASTGPFTTTAPGAKLQTEERVPFFMAQTKGWLQFIPSSGSANLWVWELL